MKPGKVRNQQIYRATNQVRNKQLGASLSKQLRQKYGRRHIRILDGDVVKITRGEYKGINGKLFTNPFAISSFKIKNDKWIETYYDQSIFIKLNYWFDI